MSSASIAPVRRVLPVGLQRVRPGPDDPLVPVPAGAEQLRAQIPDPVADLRLALPGRRSGRAG